MKRAPSAGGPATARTPASAAAPRRDPPALLQRLPGPRRLSTRIFVVFVGLLLLVQLATFAVLRGTAEARERGAIERQLATAQEALQTLLAHNNERLTGSARVTAGEHGLLRAESASTGLHAGIDRATVEDALDNNLRRLCRASGPDGRDRSERCEAGAQAAVFDVALNVQGSVPAGLHGSDAALGALAQALRPGGAADPCRRARDGTGTGGAVLPKGATLTQYVLVPRCNPALSGWVLMGFAIDRSFADDLRRISGVHLQLLARAAPGQDWHHPVGTLPPAAAGALLQALGPAMPGPRLMAGSEEYGTRTLTLGEGAQGQALALLALSLDEAMAPFEATQRLLAAVTLAAVAVYAFGAALLSRGITQPLAELVRALGAMKRGRYDQPVRVPARRDEIGAIAAGVEDARVGICQRSAELAYKAFHDELTGLVNRASFFDLVRQRVRERPQAPCAVLLLSFNRFHVIQETLGPSCGDGVLREVARRLRERIAVRDDVVARVGDHQFAMLLPQAGLDGARAACDEVHVALLQPLQVDGHAIDAEVTCGIACWPQHAPAPAADGGDTAADLGRRAEMLVARAELAMYVARDQVLPQTVYAAELDPDNADTLSLKSELTHAIRNHELRLFLQPKLCLHTRRFVAAEALVRWQRGAELVPPMKFIPFAEDTGFVRELTKWVFEEAARLWPTLQGLGLQRVAVNLSARDLMPELPQVLGNVLARCGVPASAFCLEVTESAIMGNPKRAQEVLTALAMAGFRLSIDDYGEGATSLQYLKKLPVHELKIDQVFIRRIDEDSKDAKIVRSTIGLAHSLGLEVVAEGVENAAALQLLAEMGADQVQGFHLSRPLPVAEFAALMGRWLPPQGGAGTAGAAGLPAQPAAQSSAA